MVYLVDDDADDLEIIQAALTQNRYLGPVTTAANGKVLLDILGSGEGAGRSDVIILDLNMPLMDGFQVLQEIRRHQMLRSIPVVVLTSSRSKQDEVRCLELGCSFFFSKPDRLAEYEPIARIVKNFAEVRG